MITPLRFGAKIWKQGNSLILTIPKELREAYSLKEGDYLDIFARLVTEEELKKKEEIRRIKASYPYEATGKIIHKNEKVVELKRVFFNETEYRAGTLSPGESFDNLPTIKEIYGVIMTGFFLDNANTKKHYKNYILDGKNIRKDLLFEETIKLKTFEGKEIIIRNIRFENSIPITNPIKNIKFSGHLEKDENKT